MVQKSRGKLGNVQANNFTAIAFSEKGFACVGADNGCILAFVNGECKKSFQVPIISCEAFFIDKCKANCTCMRCK